MIDLNKALAALSSQGIREKSNHLTAEEMRAYIEAQVGPVSDSLFKRIMAKKIPLEGYYQDRIKRHLEALYPEALIWKASAGPYSQGGLPDIHMLLDGHFYGFEVKRPYIGVPSPLQIKTIEQIEKAGGTAAVVCWPKECEAIICASRNHQRRF